MIDYKSFYMNNTNLKISPIDKNSLKGPLKGFG